ncbi:MAG: hypothetical protein J6T12_07975 [Salinivirgaceae bacterium]|nr:hypothetical protein [Salinivirgaceae bacterium]
MLAIEIIFLATFGFSLYLHLQLKSEKCMGHQTENTIQISESEKSIRKIESMLLSNRTIKSYHMGLADVLWLGVGGIIALDIVSGVLIAKDTNLSLTVSLIILLPILLQIFAGVLTIIRFYGYKGDAVAMATSFVVPKLFLLLAIGIVYNIPSIHSILGQFGTDLLGYAIGTIISVSLWLAYFYISFEVECAIPKRERYWSVMAKAIMVGYAIIYTCYAILLYFGLK